MEISVTLILIIITTLVSIGAFNDQRLVDKFIFYPPSVNKGEFYRFFSSGIIHADWGHLIFNMLALYLFGIGRVETELGPINMGVEYNFISIFGEKGRYLYLGMYILALMASLLPTYLKNKDNYQYRSLGASGAVSAVIFAGILLKPMMGMGLFFIPVYVAGFIFGLIYLVISSWLDKRGSDNINHSAHIFGALFGVGITIILCMAFSDYPVLESFVNQIKTASPSDWIQFGR